MKAYGRVVFVVALALGTLALTGVVVTRYWVSATPQAAPSRTTASADAGLVDEQPLITAQRLAALAITPDEKELSQTAIHVADHEVDLTFTSALRNATLHPAPLPPAIKPLVARIETIQDRVKTNEKEVAHLKQVLAGADEKHKPAVEEDLQLQQAMLEVDQEDLDAAKQELIRAGGDPRSIIQRLMDQHEAWGHAQTTATAETKTPQQQSESRTLLVQWQVWRRLATEERELTTARQEVSDRAAKLAKEHQALAAGAQAPAAQASAGVFSVFKELAEEQKNLGELDKRSEDLKQLGSVYTQWSALVTASKRAHLFLLLEASGWIVVLLLLVLLANPLLSFIFAQISLEGRRLHTFLLVARFAVQALGLGLVLLIIFGPPNQLATVVALAGAGLTVALKDFIVGFFGWFILMGRNGIRPGDWVEINGIGGEVVEVGLLHTVLLETGDWSNAGHPTGRKVTFANSFAIEGHYFNFSSTGQWLWDEIVVPVPAGTDPYPVAEAVQKDVLEETKANMLLAEKEWQRVVPGQADRESSAAPDISVRPTTLGVNVIVRYITRAHERHETRTRLFYRIVEHLRGLHLPHPPLDPDATNPPAEQIVSGTRKRA